MLEPVKELLQGFFANYQLISHPDSATCESVIHTPATTGADTSLSTVNGGNHIHPSEPLFDNGELRSSTCEMIGSLLVQPLPQLLVTPGRTQPTNHEEVAFNAVRRNDEALCKTLLSSLKPDIQDSEGRLLLHWAALNGSLSISRLLLTIKSSETLKVKDKLGRTALHCACIASNPTLVELFIQEKADVNAVDAEGNSALHYAAAADDREMVRCLVNAGAKVRARNGEGRIPQNLAGPQTLPLLSSSSSRPSTSHIPIASSSQAQIDYLMGKSTSKPSKPGPTDYELLTLLGKGSFGEVFLVKRRSDSELFAMKVLRKDVIMGQNLVKYAMTERNVLSYIKHPFIVSLEAAFQTSTSLFLILNYCPGGDLGWHLAREKRFSEHRARIYAAEVLLALEELHQRDIIFRDLKPDNVVIDGNGHAMLTDFGLSREGVYSATAAQSFCGSLAYLAPEVVKRKGHGKAVDWYLLGVLMFEMMTGMPPFYSQNRKQLLDNILYATLKIPENMSAEARDLIRLVSAM